MNKKINKLYETLDQVISKTSSVNLEFSKTIETILEASVAYENLEKKEKLLGLQDNKKLYGFKSSSDARTEVLKITLDIANKNLIDKFLIDLDIFNILSDDEKKLHIYKLKDEIQVLRDNNINPKNLIINKQRFKIWDMVENNFSLTLKQLNVSIFLNRVNILKAKYKEEIES